MFALENACVYCTHARDPLKIDARGVALSKYARIAFQSGLLLFYLLHSSKNYEHSRVSAEV